MYTHIGIELTPSRTSVLIVLGTVTTLAVLYNMTVPSYSTERPKRLWIQHLKRSYMNIQVGVLCAVHSVYAYHILTYLCTYMRLTLNSLRVLCMYAYGF